MARLESDKYELTPLQQKLWEALADGENHPNKALCALVDEQCDLTHLRYLMSCIRTKVRALGSETVISEEGGYRRVAYVKNALS